MFKSEISQKSKKGVITIYVLIFGIVFLLLLGGLFSYTLNQFKVAVQREAWNEALNIAEAGLNYYRWCLNNDVGEECLVEEENPFHNPSGEIIGYFSLDTNREESCGVTIQENITSTGWTIDYPDIERSVSASYARESVASYSYILNNNVWIGSDHEIRGPYHSNGGVRFDGENQSIVTSAMETWICTSSFGCSTSEERDGVFTTTAVSDPSLFDFPVSSFDFNGITVDLAQMKSVAQTSGVYLPPSPGEGYHVIFRNDGTFETRVINGLSRTWGYSVEDGWHYDYFTITSEGSSQIHNVPSGCSAIFIEDNIWPEGEVSGKIAVASANLINPNIDTDVILQNDINYVDLDGSDGLVLIGQGNILIGPNSPNQMELRGIFIAQKGRFSRNHYQSNLREKLEIYGSIVSNGRVGTQWVSGSTVVSGYQSRESYFDSNLIYNSPVFTPYISPDFELIDWKEE